MGLKKRGRIQHGFDLVIEYYTCVDFLRLVEALALECIADLDVVAIFPWLHAVRGNFFDPSFSLSGPAGQQGLPVVVTLIAARGVS